MTRRTKQRNNLQNINQKKVMFTCLAERLLPKRPAFEKRYTYRQAFGKLDGCSVSAMSIWQKRWKAADVRQVKYLPNG